MEADLTEIIRGDPKVSAMLSRTLGDEKLVAEHPGDRREWPGAGRFGSNEAGRKANATSTILEGLKDRNWIENLRA